MSDALKKFTAEEAAEILNAPETLRSGEPRPRPVPSSVEEIEELARLEESLPAPKLVPLSRDSLLGAYLLSDHDNPKHGFERVVHLSGGYALVQRTRQLFARWVHVSKLVEGGQVVIYDSAGMALASAGMEQDDVREQARAFNVPLPDAALHGAVVVWAGGPTLVRGVADGLVFEIDDFVVDESDGVKWGGKTFATSIALAAEHRAAVFPAGVEAYRDWRQANGLPRIAGKDGAGDAFEILAPMQSGGRSRG